MSNERNRISREDAKILLDRLWLRYQALNTAWEGFAEICSAPVSSPLGTAVWTVFDGYVRSIELLLCDELHVLTWFIWTNEFGAKELGHTRPPHTGARVFPVRTISDFLDVLGYTKSTKIKTVKTKTKKVVVKKK